MAGNWIQQNVTTGGTGNVVLGAASSAARHTIHGSVDIGKQFEACFEDGNDKEISLCTLVASTPTTATVARVAVKETLVSGTHNRTNPTALNLSTSATMRIVQDANGYLKAGRRIPYQAASGIVGNLSMHHTGLQLVTIALGPYRNAYPYKRGVAGFVSECSVICTVALASATLRISAHEVLHDNTVGPSFGEFTSVGSELDVSTTGIKTATAASPIWLPADDIYIVEQASANGVSCSGVSNCASMSLGVGANTVPIGALFRTDDISQIGEDETGNAWSANPHCVSFYLRDI